MLSQGAGRPVHVGQWVQTAYAEAAAREHILRAAARGGPGGGVGRAGCTRRRLRVSEWTTGLRSGSGSQPA